MSKDFKEHKVLGKPFNKDGGPSLTTSIVATLLPNKPIRKNDILKRLGEKHEGKTRGYLAHNFKELTNYGILAYDKSKFTWSQGENFLAYMGFVMMSLASINETVNEGMSYLLLPKHEAQSLDFIFKPEEEVFNKPNPYLDD